MDSSKFDRLEKPPSHTLPTEESQVTSKLRIDELTNVSWNLLLKMTTINESRLLLRLFACLQKICYAPAGIMQNIHGAHTIKKLATEFLQSCKTYDSYVYDELHVCPRLDDKMIYI